MNLERIDLNKEFKISKYTPHNKCMHVHVRDDDGNNIKCAKNMNNFFSARENTLKFAAKINIPLFPNTAKAGCKQIVLGSTKFLLPYLVLPQHFIVLSSKPDVWSEKLNNTYMFCVAIDFFNKQSCAMPIRLVTTPDNMRSKTGMRITAKEICQLNNMYNLTFYKYISDEHINLYFLSNVSMKDRRHRIIQIDPTSNKLFYTVKGKTHDIEAIHI